VRVVLDTSVLISAIRSDRGAAAEVVRLAIGGAFTLLLDYKLVSEYRDVAFREIHIVQSGKTRKDVKTLIDLLEDIADPVFVAFKHRPLSRDANDDMVLDVAINGGAYVLLTRNIRDFTAAAKPFGIRVLTPRDFLSSNKEGFPSHAR
jgi:putative PIN family toxin of toxin-antitoxin system